MDHTNKFEKVIKSS